MIKTWLKNQPTLLERIDVFVQILKIVSVDGKPVYMPDSYEIDRRMANQVEPDGERLEEMITKLQDVSIRHNICVDESFCLGILLFYLLSNEGKREVDFSEKLTDLIYSEAKFYEFGANQIDMTLAASEELEPYRKLGEELTSFDKDKRLSIIELQERLIDILRYIKCNVRYIDDADEENIIKTEEIRYEAFANVLSPDIEYLPAYRVVKEKKFYIRAIEVTIDVEVEANDDMHSEYKKVGFPEDTVVIVYHKSFFTVYRNSFDDATQISITL